MSEQVILVDEFDQPIGVAEKLAAHHTPGQLHRAFSVFIFNKRGALLLQQRAETKYHFAGLWSNACCGHPRPGETTLGAATRRLEEELRFRTLLVDLFSFTYSATHEDSGLVEREIDHVCAGLYDGTPTPDPQEAGAVRWIALVELDAEMSAAPQTFTPWFKIAVKRAVEAWRRLPHEG